jgi:CRP/FNR family transcriptional regulator, cyclic AMP receptor protein
MAIEKCINEFGIDDIIFEEGSSGRELIGGSADLRNETGRDA